MAANVFSDDKKTSLREAGLIIQKVFFIYRSVDINLSPRFFVA